MPGQAPPFIEVPEVMGAVDNREWTMRVGGSKNWLT